MRIEIHIDEREINNIAGKNGEDFIIEEIKRDPKFFLANASNIIVHMEAK